MKKIDYLRRIFSTYLTKKISQLTFWHEVPAINLNVDHRKLGEYYQTFDDKADYRGNFDDEGIILLDYRGKIGKQYYPIAIAQYGLACFNRYKRTNEKIWLKKTITQGGWLVNNLLRNKQGCFLWYAQFDWEYRDELKAPWSSALAQGNGLSLLVRLYKETGNKIYLDTADRAYRGLITEIKDGGVALIDKENNLWFEEAIVEPPTHILNGFMWTIMGVYDYYLLTKEESVKQVFDRAAQTLKTDLHKYDVGFWSLYELSGMRLKMLASPFYHSLHIVQLKIVYKLTGESIFLEYANRWQAYQRNLFKRSWAVVYKIIFKLLYY